MTLKELLDRCDFKDIAPVIRTMYPDMEGSLIGFKEAFDILRHLNPEAPEADIENPDEVIKISKSVDEFSQETYYRVTPSCGVIAWEAYLVNDIIVEDGVILNDHEIVACCLWEMTFYGFDLSTSEKWSEALGKRIGIIDA
jgi:hypothetical protein